MTHLKSALIFLGLPLAAALLASATGVTQIFGAHPWWAQQVIWIGLLVGLTLAAIARALPISHIPRVAGFVLLTLTAIATATTGKSRFAASYAEDAFAGQMWYFGWIGICALTAATLASLLTDHRLTH
ncbi:MAG: hypothetical protein ACI8R4_004186 [Paracoccaceae bacterium]|jgi:hypothetical protein